MLLTGRRPRRSNCSASSPSTTSPTSSTPNPTKTIRDLPVLTDVNLEEGGETVFDSIRKRMPWLVVLLFINMITSGIVAGFETVLSLIPILAMFMPLIFNMAGNSGTQSSRRDHPVCSRPINWKTKTTIRKHLFRGGSDRP
ncbi:MAG: hypothetical protein MZU97_25330 [Bacillus subtilis]|nr:hypothetical protein [Bacillus subtilis]